MEFILVNGMQFLSHAGIAFVNTVYIGIKPCLAICFSESIHLFTFIESFG